MNQKQQASILLVEDDMHLTKINKYVLESEGYEVITAATLEEARSALMFHIPDIILLDVKLPDGNGFDFCREIRENTDAHIIFLTSVTEFSGEMEGLVAGGDDYLRKPYSTELLHERVKKALLRREREHAQTIKRGPLTLDIIAGRAFIDDCDMQLSTKEFLLLLLFVRQSGKTMNAEYLYKKVWGQAMCGDTTAIKTAVSRLRTKLKGSGHTIISEYGAGYRLE